MTAMKKFKWRFCPVAEHEHQVSKRQYAHTFHYGKTICTCHALWKLPKRHRDGILLHEIGHLLAGKHGTEADANRMALRLTGHEIVYIDSPYYGDDLESVD